MSTVPVPASPQLVETAAADLAVTSRRLGEIAVDVRAARRGLGAAWSGPAADAARTAVGDGQTRLGACADALRPLEPALTAYALALRHARGLQAQGDTLLDRAVTAQLTEAGAPVSASRTVALKAADRTLADAAALQQQAWQTLRVADETAAAAVRAATAALEQATPTQATMPAPPPVVSSGGIAPGASTAAHAELGNAVASGANAAWQHPGDLAAVLGGGALAALGATGVLAGGLATATGGGAVVGLPVGAASIGAVLAGAGIATAGAVSLATHALSDSAVAPFRVDQQREPVEGPAPYPPPEEITGRTRHGDERAQGRGGHGVSDAAMEDAVANPVEEPSYDVERDTYKYVNEDAVVILNKDGEVVTTWALNSRGHRR